ncbi:MAG: hypothetical protein AAFQ82_25180, partial [Myxococcota bacterium]
SLAHHQEQVFDYDTPIRSLRYVAPGDPYGADITIGVDGVPVSAASYPFERRQVEVETVADPTGAQVGDRLDGYIAMDRPTGDEDNFIALRWAAEQFPTSFVSQGDDGTSVVLLDGRRPGFERWEDLYIADNVAALNSDNYVLNPDLDADSPYGRAKPSPIGLAKTWEIWVWRDVDVTVPLAVRNAFAQGGVRAFIDPEFGTQADLPSPMAPPCAACSDAERTIETAMDDMFEFVTRTRTPGEPTSDHTRGSLFFGDILYGWRRVVNSQVDGNVLYRYWLNHGQSFAVVPWMRWIRSGDVRSLDFAEAHGRHLMDVDTVHVRRGACGGANLLCKVPGAQGDYAPVPGAFQETAVDDPNLVSSPTPPTRFMRARRAVKTNESEYLSLYYHLTGYERARDVAEERAKAIGDVWFPDPNLPASESALRTLFGAYFGNLPPDKSV